ncbi:hypothetical protein [Tamlana sp. I1]|uniref:hypothetical protein n=1 Tax=Tamlana sp. I1 TaxID=2762061 RepID=UPI00188FD18D|nr:hypothetical protein [Tamlana sp. I1]
MKKIYLLFFLMTSLVVSAQSECDNANSYLVNAYSHVKDSYESNNVSHLKYYANRSVESLKLAKEALNLCNCKKAKELTNKTLELLVKVDNAETFEDGRFFVKRGRDLSKESVIEIDKCAFNQYQDNQADENYVAAQTANSELSDLQAAQLQLEQQQQALKLKAEQIKNKLAEQKERELELEKQQIVESYKTRILENIKSYNETLKVYNTANFTPISFEDTPIDIQTKSISEIKSHYINQMKALTKDYLEALNRCETS